MGLPEEEVTGGTTGEAVGLKLYRPGGGYAGQLTTRPGYEGLWFQQPTGWSKFTGGTYLSENGSLLSINAAGDIVMQDKPEAVPAGSAPAWSSTQAAAQLQHDWDVAEALRQEAVARGDLQAQREWEALQNEIQRHWEDGNRLWEVRMAEQAQGREFAWEEEQTALQNKWQDDKDLWLAQMEEQAQGRRFEFEMKEREAAQAFATGEREETQKFTAEQNRLAEEGRMKRQHLGVLSDLVSSFMSAQQGARETLATMGPDPFAQAAGINLMPMFGTSPQQAFQGTLENYIAQPIPQVGPGAGLPEIQGAISAATGLQAPPLPQSTFGIAPSLAAGGTVTPAPVPQSFLVGEKGTEVMTVTPQGVTVTPLKGGFQFGGTVPFDVSSLQQALAPIYANLGLTNTPTFSQGQTAVGGWDIQQTGGMTSANMLRTLGIMPSLIREIETSDVFMRDPQTGALRYVPGQVWEQMGLQNEDVINLFAPDVRALGMPFGPPISAEAPIGRSPGFPPAFGPVSPRITFEQQSGTILPAPYRVASELNRARYLEDPNLPNILSGYRSAGFAPATVMSRAGRAVPRGTPFAGPIGLR